MPFLNPPVLAIGLGLLAAAILFLFLRRFLSPSGIVEVTPQEAQARVKAGAQLIDVRQPAEYRTGHAPKAKLTPLSQLKRHAAEMPKGKPMVVICASGHRSVVAVDWLKRWGFEDVVSVRGGTAGWRAANLPVTKE